MNCEERQGPRQLFPITGYSPVRECSIRTPRREVVRYLIYQRCVGERINILRWGGFRKIQTVKNILCTELCTLSLP